MNTTHLVRVRRIFSAEHAPRHVVRHNMRAWVRSVRHLGSQWLLAQQVQRREA